MDYNPRSPMTDFFKTALHRVDDVVFCFAIAAMSIAALVVSIKNIVLGTHSDADWRIPWLVLLMVPCLTFVYFRWTLFCDRQNDKFGRVSNALFLLGITVYFFVKIF